MFPRSHRRSRCTPVPTRRQRLGVHHRRSLERFVAAGTARHPWIGSCRWVYLDAYRRGDSRGVSRSCTALAGPVTAWTAGWRYGHSWRIPSYSSRTPGPSRALHTSRRPARQRAPAGINEPRSSSFASRRGKRGALITCRFDHGPEYPQRRTVDVPPASCRERRRS